VGVLIERQFDVRFGPTGMWRTLDVVGFSVQKPEHRAIERDENSVLTWTRRTWPGLKKPSDRDG
jgi:transposase